MRVEVLDRSGRNVTDEFGEPYCGLFHLFKLFRSRDGDGRLFDDLLVSSLDGTVSTKKRDRIPILIGNELDLQMTC
jgi:hypothetical protein